MGRAPMAHPPGSDTRARPMRATSGPSTRTDARIVRTRSYGASGRGNSLASMRSVWGPTSALGVTFAPRWAMRRPMVRTSARLRICDPKETIFQAGWELVKFYFMIGLPTERDEDVKEIVRVCAEALRRGKRAPPKAAINV